MSNNYEDYGYDYNQNEKNATLRRRILIVVLIVLAIILLLVLIKGCDGKKNSKIDNEFDYEKTLVTAGKKYFSDNELKYPKVEGTCEEIELQGLIDRGYVNSKDFEKCNSLSTYVKVCRLEDKSLHYHPWLVCSDKNSEEEYATANIGTLKDVINDESVITFKYQPLFMTKSTENLGDVEEVWKDEIKYVSYKTLDTITYYRYRDELFKWNYKDKKYYTSQGEKSNADDVNEYYPSSPNSNYTERDNETMVYKWFTTESKKIYAVDSNGTKVYSHTAISGYPYNEGGVCVEYQTRTVTGTHRPKHYWVCAKSKNSTVKTYQLYACGGAPNTELVYEIDNFWTCGSGSEEDILNGKVSSSSVTCNTYSAWKFSETSCDEKLDTCRKIQPYCVYTWYKLEENAEKKYYPSGSSNASSERIYYASAPINGASKDESTRVVGYKWYNSTTKVTSDYLATAPSSDATKTNDSKWSDWSDYSTKNPSINDGRNRNIETRIKIKLQEIKGITEGDWKNLTDKFLSLDEMINILNINNYKVNSLEDIHNNGELKYKIQMLIRNKKESK